MHQRAGAAAGEQGLDRLVRLEVLDSYLVYQGPADLLGTPRVQQLTEVERLRLRKQVTLAHRLSEVQGLHEAVQTKGPQVVGRVEGLNLVSTTLTTADVTGICGEKPECLVDRPLLLIKWADRQEAQVGDLVTFYLKYSNNGSRPISDVAVSDSLTGRLEYIPSSAKSDRNAVFTLQENEAGSLVLRWEISGRLLPGESGKVSFQARIR
jgi:uncharacterized repeat protein (TIGR01451 family)